MASFARSSPTSWEEPLTEGRSGDRAENELGNAFANDFPSSHDAVALAVDGLQNARLLRRPLDLLAQGCNVDIDRSAGDV